MSIHVTAGGKFLEDRLKEMEIEEKLKSEASSKKKLSSSMGTSFSIHMRGF